MKGNMQHGCISYAPPTRRCCTSHAVVRLNRGATAIAAVNEQRMTFADCAVTTRCTSACLSHDFLGHKDLSSLPRLLLVWFGGVTAWLLQQLRCLRQLLLTLRCLLLLLLFVGDCFQGYRVSQGVVLSSCSSSKPGPGRTAGLAQQQLGSLRGSCHTLKYGPVVPPL